MLKKIKSTIEVSNLFQLTLFPSMLYLRTFETKKFFFSENSKRIKI